MNENPSSPQTEPQIQTAVLLLPAKSDFYWQNLAEVPFLLRNTLTLQRAGIKKLMIWSENTDAFQQKLKQDPRMNLDVEWIVDNAIGLHDTHVMVLDGSTLLEKAEIVEAMTPSTQYQTDGFHFFPEVLKEKNLIKVIPPRESSRLINKEDFRVAEERLLKSVGLSNDSLMDRLITATSICERRKRHFGKLTLLGAMGGSSALADQTSSIDIPLSDTPGAPRSQGRRNCPWHPNSIDESPYA